MAWNSGKLTSWQGVWPWLQLTSKKVFRTSPKASCIRAWLVVGFYLQYSVSGLCVMTTWTLCDGEIRKCWCYAWTDFSLNLPMLCSSALLKTVLIASLPLTDSSSRSARARARGREKRKGGRKTEGVTLLPMIWNHKCKFVSTDAPLPLHAKRPTAVADAGFYRQW